MPAIVLLGHPHHCPSCGPTSISSGSSLFFVNGRAAARVGDRLGCGAVITSGSALMMDDGQPLARVGDATSHGGTLENGDNSWLLD